MALSSRGVVAQDADIDMLLTCAKCLAGSADPTDCQTACLGTNELCCTWWQCKECADEKLPAVTMRYTTTTTTTSTTTSTSTSTTPTSTFKVVVTAVTATETYAETSATEYISFKVGSVWTKDQIFFTGSEQGETEQATFVLDDFPTELRLSTTNTDGWGWDYFAVEVNTRLYVLFCEGSQVSASSAESYYHWIDGDSCAGPTSTVLEIENNKCS